MNVSTSEKKRFPYLFAFLLCLLVSFYYYSFFFNRAVVDVELEVEQDTKFKVYWAKAGENFSEKRRASVNASPGRQHYRVHFTDLGSVARIRLDPMEYQGEATVTSIVMTQPGFAPFHVDLSRVQPLHDIIDHVMSEDGLHVISEGDDPSFLIIPVLEKQAVTWSVEAARYAFIFLALIIVIKACVSLGKNFAWIPIMSAMVFSLILTMAIISTPNAHPDEYVHLDAARYYLDHWLPPVIDDPAIEHTYSAYGVSRLNNGEIYYLFAGKLARLTKDLVTNEVFALRLFNVLLFGCIVLYTVRSVKARLVALPFLISPQVWYLFSYCVSDTFGLFLCFLAGCEVVRPNSFLNRLLNAHVTRGLARSILALAVLVALMILLKINYDPFIALFYITIAWLIFKERDGNGHSTKIVIVRVVVFTLIALLLAALRIGADYYVNGVDRSVKLAVMQEKTAHRWYKPSTELNKRHVSLYLKERGTSLKAMILLHHWFGRTFNSGVGMYGYFTIYGSDSYFEWFKWCLWALLGFIVFKIFWRGGLEHSAFLVLILGLVVALLAVSVYRSWTIDLQPQGRYLFPILPMFGLVLARAEHLFASRVFNLIVVHLFVLSLYSFVFIGLVSIPKPG